MSDFEYLLKTPFDIETASGNKVIKKIIVSPPTRRTKNYIFKFRKMIQSALMSFVKESRSSDTKVNNEQSGDIVNNDDKKVKDDFRKQVSFIIYAESNDMDKMIDLLENILKLTASLDNGQPMDNNTLDKLSIDDIEGLLVEYTVNFTSLSQNLT